MTDVLESLVEQLAELQLYKARFGALDLRGEAEDVSSSETE